MHEVLRRLLMVAATSSGNSSKTTDICWRDYLLWWQWPFYRIRLASDTFLLPFFKSWPNFGKKFFVQRKKHWKINRSNPTWQNTSFLQDLFKKLRHPLFGSKPRRRTGCGKSEMTNARSATKCALYHLPLPCNHIVCQTIENSGIQVGKKHESECEKASKLQHTLTIVCCPATAFVPIKK